MRVPDVTEWLHSLGLERYAPAFRDNDIDGEVLPDLDDADLEKLGVSLGHRKRLLKAIAALGGSAGASADEAAAAPEPQGERRQVTVLFADLVGYTRLTHQLGAEATHDIADRFFSLADGVVERFGGTIDKHIGDCVMAVFGAPVAHGNDPERAVRAALAIRDAMPELSREFGRDLDMHAGIASGQVVASSGAGHRTYSITGASVNLASRLTDQAGPATILVSEQVRHPLADRLECVEVEALTLKGLEAPVRAFRVIGLHDRPAPAERPFVGRRAELQLLEGVLEACLADRRGKAVYVRGEAGIGKTRLLEELQRLAGEAGFECHKGLVLDFGAGAGQDAIGSLVRSLLGLAATDDGVAAGAGIDAAVRDGLTTAERRVFLNDLMDLPQPTELRTLYDAMDNRARTQGKQDTLAELVERAGLQKPRLVLVEDVHWADGPTLGHLARLATATSTARAVLVMTSRLEGDPLDQVWRSNTGGTLLTLDLGPLADEEASVLADLYVDASAELVRRCIARAAGNPLFLDQLLRHAEENAQEGVPGSVQSLVQARLDHLATEDRQALQAASVLGQRFTPEALGHLLGRPSHDCAALVHHRLIRSTGDEFLFAHALIRDGVYDSLLTSRRAALHLRAAQWYVTRDPALHALHLDRANDPGAPDAYLDAARGQLATYRYDAALDLAERGLALARTAEQRFALTCLRGEILHDLGAMAEAGDAYAAALETAADDAGRCRAWLGLAAVKRVIENLDGAFADLERAEAAARALGLKDQLARIHFLRGNLRFPRGELEDCLEEHSKSLAFAQEVGARDLESAALGGLGDAEYARGRMLTAHRYFRRCIEICREHGFGRIEVTNLPMAAVTLFYAGDLPKAYQEAVAAVEAAEQVGHYRAAIIGSHIVYCTAMAQGEATVARKYVDRGLELSRQLGARRFEAEGLWFHAELLRAGGRRAEAIATIRQALEISRATGMSYIGPAILGALAQTTDRADERQAALAEAEQLLAAGSISHNYLWFYQDAIETSITQRDWAGTERYTAALATYTRAEPLPFADAFIERARALAAFYRDPRGPGVAQALAHARRRAEEIGWVSGLPALEAALADAAAE